LWDAVSGFLFSANWRFAASGTDYFEAQGPVSPLQHYWSLSVEEQFYFVWPWLMLGVLALAARSGLRRRRSVMGIVMGIIVAASLGWAMIDTAANPALSYFSTFTRAWELGVGALIAIAAPLCARLPDSLRPVLAWVGLVGIGFSIFYITDGLPFPAPWALLPVVSTAAVIAAGTEGRVRLLAPLTNKVAVYIGNVSYSLYLWHFPVIIITGALIGEGTPLFFGLALALIAVTSLFSYYLVELPLHRSPWMEVAKSGGRRKESWRKWRDEYANSYRYKGLALLATIVLAFVTLAMIPVLSPPPASITVPISATPADPEAEPSSTPELDLLQVEIATALNSTQWPATVTQQIGSGSGREEQFAECANPATISEGGCTWGDGPRRVVLVGDSTASAYAPAFRDVFTDAGWTFQSFAMTGQLSRKDRAVAAIVSSVPELVWLCVAEWQSMDHHRHGE
jgi:hypothetical protein